MNPCETLEPTRIEHLREVKAHELCKHRRDVGAAKPRKHLRDVGGRASHEHPRAVSAHELREQLHSFTNCKFTGTSRES